MSEIRRRVLYVSPNPVGSALVRSQVLPYIRGLELQGYAIDLLTFERGPVQFPEGEHRRDRWRALSARTGAGLIPKVIDIAVASAIAVVSVARSGASAVHARSYLPAAIAWLVKLFTRRPYLFDMRGFLADEYLDSGYWASTDLRYRILRWAESLLLRGAAEIVVLTSPARERVLRSSRPMAMRASTVTVIPSAVDLDRFRPGFRGETPTLVYAGSLGTYYELDEMLRVYAFAREHEPRLRFVILNVGQQELAHEAIDRHGLRGEVAVRGADYRDMPEALATAHVGIALIKRTPSKRASSAIKVAEYLASGLPSVVGRDLGDAGVEIAAYRAGHVLDDFSEGELRRAGLAVARLAGDPSAAQRARKLAEDRYDVRAAVAVYATIYGRLTR